MSDEHQDANEWGLENPPQNEQDEPHDDEVPSQEAEQNETELLANDHEIPFGEDNLSDDATAIPALEQTWPGDENPFPADDLARDNFLDIMPEQKAGWEESMGPVLEKLEQIRNSQEQLAKDFSLKLKYDATKQEQIDKLYRENQGFQENVMEKFRSQLVLAVIEQIDDAEKQISHFDKQEDTEKNYAKLLNCFRDLTVSFQDMLLERFDISVYRSEPGQSFDPKRQRALKTSDTSDVSQGKTVATTIRPGYEKNDGTVLRPEMVEVYRYNQEMQVPEMPTPDVSHDDPEPGGDAN